MRSLWATIVLFLGAVLAVPAAAGEEEMWFKNEMDAAWKGNFENLVGVIDDDLRECDLLIATPEASDDKTLDLWEATVTANNDNYTVLVESLLVDGKAYLDRIPDGEILKRTRCKLALEAGRRWKESYDIFLRYVVRGDSVMAMSFVRNANRAMKDAEAMRDGAEGIFAKLGELVGEADADLGTIEEAVRDARSRKELEEQERKLRLVSLRVLNARAVLAARLAHAESFFGDKTYDELEDLLLKAIDRYEKAAESEQLKMVLAGHLEHLGLWRRLLMERWKYWSEAFGEADRQWQPFTQQTLFESTTHFKGLPYADLSKPVEELRRQIEDRRRELR